MKLLVTLLLISAIANPVLCQIVHWEMVWYQNNSGVTDIKITSNKIIFACNESRILKSTNGGSDWISISLPSTSKLVIDSLDNIYVAKAGHQPGIVKSTDFGTTWVVSYSGYVKATSMYITTEGYIYVGDASGRFLKSTDSGNSWITISITDKEISSITTLQNGQIFVSTLGRSLFTSTDYGETWAQIVDPNLLNFITSVIADSNGFLYAERRDKISKSTDIGQTWFLTGFISSYPSSPVFGLDDNNALYYANTKVFKSSDEGENWSNMGGPSYIRCILLDGDRIYIGTSNAIYRHDPSIPIYVGNNYLPLNIGNRWQFIGKGTSSYQGNLYYGYWLAEIEVTDDSLINGTKYYKYLNDWVRYSEEDKKIYVWYDEVDKSHIDLTLIPETSFLQFPLPYHNNSIFNNHQNRIATFKHGYSAPFGTEINYKGYGFDTSYIGIVEYEACRYSENIGPYYYLYSNQNLAREHTIIMALINDSLGNLIEFSNNYRPHITAIPLTAVNTNNFIMTVLVEHSYSRIRWDFNFIDSVHMESYYQKNDSIIYNENVMATSVPFTANYQVYALLDTNLLIDDFEFRFRIVAKDKGIIPGISYSPDSGYYKCIWDFGTNVNEEESIISNYSLYQNYPNPFNPATTLRFQIPFAGDVTLKVYDILGREVAVLVDEFKPMGVYQVDFTAENLSSGIYYYQLTANNFITTKKMVLIR